MSFLQLRSKRKDTDLLSFPTVTTQAASSITTTTADGNGTLVNTGGSAVTARGFVYSSSVTNPTLADSVATASGTSTGAFTQTITGLSLATTYYVRAYATNAIGTGYGDTVVFITLAASFSIPRMMTGMGI